MCMYIYLCSCALKCASFCCNKDGLQFFAGLTSEVGSSHDLKSQIGYTEGGE